MQLIDPFTTMNTEESTPLMPSNHYSASTNSNEIFSTKLFITLIITISLLQTAFVVDPGNIGLIVTLGNVVAVQSGLHFKIPFVSRVIIFTAKTQKLEETNNTPTKEGLSVRLDTAM